MRTLIDASVLAAIDEVAREEKLLPREASRALLAAVKDVSAAYNGVGAGERDRRPQTLGPEARSARLHFFLPRDLGKTYEAARDLLPRLAVGATVRVVDVGAGLGASALGLAMLVRDTRPDLTLSLTLVDDDAAALRIAKKLFTRLFPALCATAQFVAGSASDFSPKGDADLILACNVLCELERGSALRADRISALVHRFCRGVAPQGHVLLIEPALKTTTRALQTLRGRLLAVGFHIAAPCTHAKECPLLVNESDWCHEDRAISLPSALIPIARGAGLHFEGLTFSYLLVTPTPPVPSRLPGLRGRVVAPPEGAKGRRALVLCYEDANSGTSAKFERLDRHRGASHDAWTTAVRGSILAMNPWPEPGRIGAEVSIEAVEEGEP